MLMSACSRTVAALLEAGAFDGDCGGIDVTGRCRVGRRPPGRLVRCFPGYPVRLVRSVRAVWYGWSWSARAAPRAGSRPGTQLALSYLAFWRFYEGVGFAGQRGRGGGDLGERGAHVRRRGGARVACAVGVHGVGVRDGEPEVALHPGQGGVADPVGADLLGADPGQVTADALPQPVVAAVGDRPPVALAQQPLA